MRSEIRVTAIAAPISRMIRPTICAPNSELASDSGMVEESATEVSRLPEPAWAPGAGLGVADGLICGKRLDALPPGIVVETPGIVVETPGTAEPTTGMFPMGRPLARL